MFKKKKMIYGSIILLVIIFFVYKNISIGADGDESDMSVAESIMKKIKAYYDKTGQAPVFKTVEELSVVEGNVSASAESSNMSVVSASGASSTPVESASDASSTSVVNNASSTPVTNTSDTSNNSGNSVPSSSEIKPFAVQDSAIVQNNITDKDGLSKIHGKVLSASKSTAMNLKNNKAPKVYYLKKRSDVKRNIKFSNMKKKNKVIRVRVKKK